MLLLSVDVDVSVSVDIDGGVSVDIDGGAIADISVPCRHKDGGCYHDN